MYQGTTPAITLNVKDHDMSGTTAFVSFKRGADILTKTHPDVTMVYDSEEMKTVIVCQLSQEETLNMRQGDAIVQIRFIDENGNAYATDKASLTVKDVIYKEIIAYGGDAT